MTCFFSNIDLPNNKENHLIAFLVPDFNKKNSFYFQCAAKMENAFTCGGLMTCFFINTFLIQYLF